MSTGNASGQGALRGPDTAPGAGALRAPNTGAGADAGREPGALCVEALVGAWALEGFEIAFDDGRPSLWPFGRDALGLLTYTADGWMSAVLARSGRAPLGVGRLENAARATAAQKAEAFDGYLSYAGRYRLEGDEVVHEVTLALAPELVGKENRRRARLDGDLLTLSYDLTPPSGVTRRYQLRWRRQSTSDSGGGPLGDLP